MDEQWKEYKLEDLLTYEQPTAYIVQSTDYNDAYKIPVLTAGKSFVIGRTNESTGIYNALPVIIFDDFTTATQYVNFPFKVKSSAMKILSANKKLVSTKFIFFRMQIIQFDCNTHKRYWIQQYSKIRVKIPPLPEQERIVSKIEELFSQLDAAVAELNAVKEKLAVYRQAVLKEAFEFNADNLVEIKAIVDDIKIGPFGSMLHKSDYINCGIPVINPQHIKNNKITPSVSISEEKANELENYRLHANDVIMGRRGEMGRVAPISTEEDGWICGTGSIIIRLKDEYDAKLYSKILASPRIVHSLETMAKGTTMKNLNEKIVARILVPQITKENQDDILSNISRRTSICNAIEQEISSLFHQAAALRQSILKQAFEGNL